MNLTQLTISEALSKLKRKEISVVELVGAYLQRIEDFNNTIGAYITISEEKSQQRARFFQERLNSEQNVSLLTGIPMGINDNIITRDVLTSCASKMLSEFIPPYDSTVNEKLRNSGAVLLGKLNMSEFSIGNSTENSYFGCVKNPWDLGKVAGGASGGAAAAVAAGMACFALGSDTGGGIRLPSSFCGVVGLKPTYGLVSRYGLIALASSLEQIGPITRNTEDCALVLNAIAGYDPKDSVSRNIKHPDYTTFLKEDIKGLRIGIPKEYIEKGLQKEVKQRTLEACKIFESLGAVVTEVSLPTTDYAIAAYYIISSAEASSNLARHDGIKYGYRSEHYEDIEELYRKTRSKGFGFEVKKRIMQGAYFLSTECNDGYYKKALKVRQLIFEDFRKAFNEVDIIVGPTTPETAFKMGEKTHPLKMCLNNIYTVSVNMAGLCAISIPCGTDSKGLPVGLQLIGKPFDEGRLLKAAYTFEKNAKFYKALDSQVASIKN